jgi:hypothetical protein
MTTLRARAIEKDDGMTMVERVARAIGMTIPNRSDATYVTPYTMLAARAAIDAMREEDEITDAMLEAGRVALHAPENRHGAVLGAVFCAMIDKALEKDMER